MERNKSLIKKRIEFVKQAINKSNAPVTKTIAKLSKKLFLAESTIWNDYTK